MADSEKIASLMKRCQRGCGGRGALDEAHNIMAECYGTIGALHLEVERLKGWIRQDGEHNDTCTKNILGEVCSYCRCGKKAVQPA